MEIRYAFATHLQLTEKVEPMDDERAALDSLQKVKHIFLAALNIEPDQREQYIRTACNENPGCIRQTLGLLERHFESGSILDSTLEELIADMESQLAEYQKEGQQQLMEINIGITESDRLKSAAVVSRLLADTYSLYLKTHGYHWNVEGPHFQQLHVQFMDQYTEMWTAVDELAERIRALGHYAPSSYSAMAKLSSIAEENGQPDWKEMVRNLATGHEQVAKSAREVMRVAEEVGDDATADIVGPRVTLHEKTAWMLRATAS